MKRFESRAVGLFCVWFALIESILSAPSPNATFSKLDLLRKEMTAAKYDAYIIPAEDEHQSEYVSDYDKKRQWLSGFTGSAGTAVVTKTKAALFSDSRYTIRAQNELDLNWIFMEQGINKTIEEWLVDELTSEQVVAMNPKLSSIKNWKNREAALAEKRIKLVTAVSDILDKIWTDRPAKPNSKIMIHNMTFAGRSWKEKIQDTLDRIKNIADIYVVTALDEVAWLLNMRATDIPYNPMFFAYAIISNDNNHRLYIDNNRLTNEIRSHLSGINFYPYEKIIDDVTELSNQRKKIWVSPMSSYAIYNAVTNKDLLVNNKASPVRSLKSVKNPIELKNARECQIRDSVARVKHMYWMEEEMKKSDPNITEVSVADKLEEIQKQDPYFLSLSFDSISAVGANAADIHYSTDPSKIIKLRKDAVYMLDAGAQYLDCTSDITRTHHFGIPTAKEILAYTKVLQGAIDLANMVFPATVFGRVLDIAARQPLWTSGLDYGHGTGHGIGYFLSVHESPPRITYNNRDEYDEPMKEGMFSSDEPGYYEEGKFGIRLETDIETVAVNFTNTFQNRKYLKFHAQSLVPFDKRLIDTKLLTEAQVDWLNTYYQRIRDEVAPRITDNAIKEYLIQVTEPFKYEGFA